MTIKRIRASDETWAFTSDMYARVNAGLVATREGGILIDTLLFPAETRQLVSHTRRLCEAGVKYVVNTQAAMDHSLGSFMFPEAELLAHRETRRYLAGSGARNLRKAKAISPELGDARVRLPRVVFDDSLVLRMDGKSVHVLHAPGPANDTCMVYVPEEKVLFASDLMMHIPLITHQRCDVEAYKQSLRRMHDFNLEVIVQGHGEILLRGEVTSSIDKAINYLNDVDQMVDDVQAGGGKVEDAFANGPEKFGISILPMNRLISSFHRQNIHHLWKRKDPQLQRRRAARAGHPIAAAGSA